MPPLFCWIPTIFRWILGVMLEVNQYLPIIVLDDYVESIFPFALPQSPHVAVGCCFLFAVCRYTNTLFSPLLFNSQRCRPIREQCGEVYFFSYRSLYMPAHDWRVWENVWNVRRHGNHVLNASAWECEWDEMRNICGMFSERVAAVWRQDDRSPSPIFLLILLLDLGEILYRIIDQIFAPSPTFAHPLPLFAHISHFLLTLSHFLLTLSNFLPMLSHFKLIYFKHIHYSGATSYKVKNTQVDIPCRKFLPIGNFEMIKTNQQKQN